jgi:hypothetical protein
MDVKDNHEEASLGAKLALELCQRVCKSNSKYIVVVCFTRSYIVITASQCHGLHCTLLQGSDCPDYCTLS